MEKPRAAYQIIVDEKPLDVLIEFEISQGQVMTWKIVEVMDETGKRVTITSKHFETVAPAVDLDIENGNIE